MQFFFSKVPNGKQLPLCKKSDQNVEKNQSYEKQTLIMGEWHFDGCMGLILKHWSWYLKLTSQCV